MLAGRMNFAELRLLLGRSPASTSQRNSLEAGGRARGSSALRSFEVGSKRADVPRRCKAGLLRRRRTLQASRGECVSARPGKLNFSLDSPMGAEGAFPREWGGRRGKRGGIRFQPQLRLNKSSESHAKQAAASHCRAIPTTEGPDPRFWQISPDSITTYKALCSFPKDGQRTCGGLPGGMAARPATPLAKPFVRKYAPAASSREALS